ncbi:MAG: leucine-rich repeat domain-containing protein [Treponema sp.]|nr:leucine-rich repeat domain-containing protein [Treponema sp.]
MKISLVILFLIFILCSGCKRFQTQETVQAQETVRTQKAVWDLLLREDYRSSVYFYDISKEYFFEAIELYKNGKIDQAMLKLEAAIEQYHYGGVYYYHYGVCFMDIQEYEYAERAFLKALQLFSIGYNDPYNERDLGGNSPIYTFDHNGAYRERYFAHYNLACVYSHTNRLDLAMEHLINALEYGYPYIDHLLGDPDLSNLLNSPIERAHVQKIYNDGFVNTVSGKSHIIEGLNYYASYHFFNDERMEMKSYYTNRSGSYEVKNYQVCIKYFNRLQKEQGPGEMENIDETEIISIKDILESEKWKELTAIIHGYYDNGSLHVGSSIFNYQGFTSVTIPDGFTSIDGKAFYGNYLNTVILADSVVLIRPEAFGNNREFSVTPDGAEVLGENLLTTITIGANVELGMDYSGNKSRPSFDNGFDDFYDNNGKQAGTYILSNGQWSMIEGQKGD